mgnify:CR=1 FL=1
MCSSDLALGPHPVDHVGQFGGQGHRRGIDQKSHITAQICRHKPRGAGEPDLGRSTAHTKPPPRHSGDLVDQILQFVRAHAAPVARASGADQSLWSFRTAIA